MRLATCEPDADGPIYMLNLMKYRAAADYGSDGEAGVSGREADDRYAPIDVLAKIGAKVVFTAEVLAGSEDWDRIGIVCYPTRRAFIEMQSRDDFKQKHVHKDAGMDHTIVMGTLPVDGLPGRTKPSRILLEVWQGEAPAGDGIAFSVEGTIVGDGRPWTGARFSVVDGGGDVDLSAATPEHQLLVVQPMVERWT